MISTSKTSFNPVVFLREVRDELTKVTWPTREETIRLTGLVVVVTLIVAFYVGALDYIFAKLTEAIILNF